MESIDYNEQNTFLAAVNNKGLTSQRGGLRLAGEKVFRVNYDDDKNVLYLKKAAGGVTVAKCNQCILVGFFDQNQKMANGVSQNPGACNTIVEALQETLKGAGY